MSQLIVVEAIGVFVIFLLGSFFHFIYKYGGKKIWMAIISPVNESIWEHLKIAFYPYLLYAILEYIILDLNLDVFIFAKAVGVTFVILTILLFEIIYPKITKKNILIVDLLVFFISIAVGQYASYYIIGVLEYTTSIYYSLSFILSIAFILGYLTFNPIKNWLFKDSITNRYGIVK